MLYKNKRELIKARKYNARMYPIYKMCSWDLLFYYAISFVFLVQIKGFSASQVMFTDAIYPLIKIVLNIPCTAIVDKIGKRKSLIIANLSLSLYIICLILSKNILSLIGAYIIMGFGFAIKGVAESNLLYDSVTQRNGKGMFSKLEELGARNYYFLDGITSIATGFLFVVNGYLPMYISLIFTLIAAVISFKFKDIVEQKSHKEKNIKYKILNYKEELRCAFKFIFKSERLRALMLFTIFFDGLIYTSYTLRETLLNELIKPQYFAIIISSLTIVSGIFSVLQEKLNDKFKNKTLSVIVSVYVPTFILIGITMKLKLSYVLTIILILFFYVIQYSMQSPYYILSSKYQKSFASSNMRNKIVSSFELVGSVFKAAVAIFASKILDITSVENCFLIIGVLFILIMFVVLIYMKKRIGLSPEQYTKNDIECLNPKE